MSYRDPLTNEQRAGEFTDVSLASVVRFHSYAPQLFGMLPMLLAEAAGGQFENLMAQSRMMEQLIGEQIYVPLQLSVMCAEDAPGMRVDPADAGTLLGTEFVDYTLAQCAVWPRGTVPQDFHDAVKSDRPVLLLSGELDPVTPPRYGDEVQRTLPNSRHFVFRGQGHSVMGVGCAPRLVAEFIAAADAKRARWHSAWTSCSTRRRSAVRTVGTREGASGARMIRVEGLRKAFQTRTGRVQAVDGVSFAAADGQITGLLGPNGAGKTTTLRMLYTLMSPDAGRVLVDGIDAAIEPTRVRAPPRRAARRARHLQAADGAREHRVLRRLAGTRRSPHRRAHRARSSRRSTCATSSTVAPRVSRRGSAPRPRLRARWCTRRATCCSTSRPTAST